MAEVVAERAGASAAAIIAEAMRAWRPPRRLRLSEWADEHFYLSAESAAEPGRWKTIPYQRGIMDAITDPTVEQVSVMKSARVGYTKIVDATIGFYMHQDPCPIMVVQPTIEDAEGYSKEEIAPMLRDCPALAALMPDPSSRDSNNTILHKTYPGGSLSVVGANSARGFRRVSRKVVIFDETDGYPPSAGTEGDQIKLGIRRSEYYWDRKIIAGSTPTIAGASRIERLFESGDQRRYFVPCPTCRRMDFLTFRKREDGRGHWMHWDRDDGSDAHFICQGCGCEIHHKDKVAMIEQGEWRAEAPFKGHASFSIWAAYSYSPNATWADIAREFLDAKAGGVEALKTFVNTALGETWVEKGDAPDWQRLYQKRERYPIGEVQPAVLVLTAGVDVQKDRLVWEVVGWGADLQSWSVDAGVIPGETSHDATWAALDELLDRRFAKADGTELTVRWMGVDSGFNTQVVYGWARRHPGRVIACKGVTSAKTLLGAPTSVDVKVNGKRYARGVKVWPVGADIAKAELYGRLSLEPPTVESGEPFPRGYCHFPEYGEDFFKQITAEHLVRRVKRTGFVVFEWEVQPGRENHWLDARNYARAAAVLCRVDQLAGAKPRRPPDAPTAPGEQPEGGAPPTARRAPRDSWLGGGRGGRLGRGGSWLKR